MTRSNVEQIDTTVQEAVRPEGANVDDTQPFRLPLGETGRRAWRNLAGSFRSIEEQLSAKLAPFSVAPGEFGVMITLAEAGGQAKMGALAHGSFISPSNLSHRVKRLESKGLLRRETDPEDRRGTVALFTEVGKKVFQDALPVYVGVVQETFLSHMSEAEQNLAADLLYNVNPSLLEPPA